MKKLNNPFLLSGFYNRAYFCDREKEIEVLNDNFNNERNTVLYSWRRMGKTALIQYFLETVEKKGDTETIYVDLLGSKNIKGALEYITEAVYEKYGKTRSGFSSAFQSLLSRIGVTIGFDPYTGMPNFSFSQGALQKPETSFNALGEFLIDRKKQVVIALDEFQRVSEYKDQNGEAVFRSWMQSFPGLRFIYSGSHRHMMAAMFLEKNRPFYRSAQLLQLQPIPLNEYSLFIQHHFKANKKTISNTQIENIYKWSRGQTFCVQLICNKLFGNYGEVKDEYLRKTYMEIIDQEAPVFSNYTNLLTETQWNVLKAVAKNEPVTNPHSKDFIQQNQLGAASSVNTALNMLVNKEIVIKDEQGYLVHDVILCRWLQSV